VKSIPVVVDLAEQPADQLRRQHVRVLAEDGATEPQRVRHQHDFAPNKDELFEQKMLEQKLLEQKLLEQKVLAQKLLEQKLLEQKLLEQNLLEQKSKGF
jgi:hypothetical protein